MRFFLIIFFFLIPSYATAINDLIIVEVKVRGDSPDNSFVKIYNPKNEPLDISGLRIRKKSSTGREYSVRVFPKESFISPLGYFLWANSRDDYHLSVGADVYSTTSISSDNSIALFSSKGDVIDALAWGDGENQFFLEKPFPYNPQEREIIKRVKNDAYQDTKNNAMDFYLFSEKDPFLKEISIKKTSLEKNEKFPLIQGLSFSILMSFLLLYFRKVAR